MSSDQLIKKIKKYSAISFVLPLITINLCLIIFNLLGTINLYPNYNYHLSNGAAEVSYKQNIFIVNDTKSYSINNCSKYIQVYHYIAINNEDLTEEEHATNRGASKLIKSLGKEGKIKTVKLIPGKIIDDRCIKNHPFFYSALSKWHFLEKIFIKAKKENKSGFSQMKNPYFYGEVSISRAARYFPSFWIFKPFIILSAIFLFFYWKNNKNLFEEFKNKNILSNLKNKFYYFGLLSVIFLILHASLLGLSFDSKIFSNIRRLVIILFIICEVLAQIFLTINLFKFKKEIKNYINPLVLKIKIIFVTLVALVTCVVFFLLILSDLDSSTKHILEWNYFSTLLIYYLLSRLLWKKNKTHVHTPEGA